MRSDEELLRSILNVMAQHRAKTQCGTALWSVVKSLTGHGSTVSTEICIRFGLDPDLIVDEPVWIDNSCQVVSSFCPECECIFTLGECCPECDRDPSEPINQGDDDDAIDIEDASDED